MKSQYDRVYSESQDYFGAEPSELVERYADLIPTDVPVLDIGMGQGRNSLALARKGHHVVGIDTSRVAVRVVRERAAREDLPLEVWHGHFRDFEAEADGFGAVMVFGLLQMLDRHEGASLLHRIRQWTRPGGVVFLTAWHVDDPEFALVNDGWERLGLHSFRSRFGENRTYLARGEILDLMLGWSVVHHFEGMGPLHRHGEGPEERHGVVELVAVKP